MNNHRTIFLSLVILLGMFIGPKAGAYTPVKRSELSNLCVNAIAQDHYGYIWIATSNGLCKSYGDRYDIYFGSQDDTSTIPANLVTNLYKASNGWLMVSTNLGVCGLEKGTTTFHRFASNGPSPKLYYGFVDFGGRLMCYGVGGLYEISFKEMRLIHRIALEERPVTSAVVGPDGRLWISDGYLLMAVDRNLKQSATLPNPVECRINALSATAKRILVGTHNGMYSLDPSTRRLSSTAIGSDTEVRHILSVNGHDFIVSTGNRGVLSYSDIADETSRTFHDLDLGEVRTNEINGTFYDRDNNLWIATFDRGEKMFTDGPRLFNADRDVVNPMRQDFVTRIAFDSYGNMWSGTRNNGLGLLAKGDNNLRYFNSRTRHFTSDYLHDFVQELSFDRQGRLWIGYNNSLVVAEPVYSPAGKPLDLRTLKTYQFKSGVVSIAEDAKGQIWIGTGGNGLYMIDNSLNVITNISKGLRSNNITRIVPYDANHVILSAYSDNIYLLNVISHSVKPLKVGDSDAVCNAIDLLVDRNHNIWIGTYQHGLFRIGAHGGEVTRCLDPTTYYDIVGLLQDNNGDIWASSSYGLYRFDNNGSLKSRYLKPNGLGGNQFHEKSVAMRNDGKLFFGGNSGIEEVTPIPCNFTESRPIQVVTSGLWTHFDNLPTKLEEIGTTDIAAVDRVELSHDENAFSIEFFAMDYRPSAGIEYSYMLKGRDKDFIYNGDSRRASYSDLAAGDYDFYVRTRYNGEEWQEPQHLLTVSVKSNPWLSTPAIIIYVILFIALIIAVNFLYVRIRLMQQRYRLSEERIKQEKQLTANRINFFTNISHELRTPLTLIYGPAKHLRKNYKNMSEARIDQSFEFIDSNIERLLTLINQLLSFRRVNNETLPLQVSKSDLAEHLLSMSKLYAVYALENNVTINFEKTDNVPSGLMTYDQDKVEKMVSNLLINAIKYSGDNGIVTVGLDATTTPEGIDNPDHHTYAVITVSDNGNGIDKDDIPVIFQPFIRLLGLDKSIKTEGFGIGLHFVSELVKEHKGVIRTVKNPGGGMTFIIIVPVSDEAFCPLEFRNPTNDIASHDPTESAPNEAEIRVDAEVEEVVDDTDGDTDDSERPRLLIVEDNDSNREFVASLFSDKYEVMTAPTGDAGLKIVAEAYPDIIISDVLMPGKTDGYELCRQVKSNQKSSHIPVILLTAKTLDQNKVQGYNCGADAYLCKPFNPEVLVACVNNLNAKRMWQANMIGASAGLSEYDAEQTISSMELSPIDKKFLEKLYAYIDENLSNCELNVNMLGRQLGFSRTNFYRKVKALTGLSPTDLLKHYRLNRAAELLLSREYNVGEVADKIGFESHSHFSSLFKKHFGVSPRTYVTEHFTRTAEE